jgi:methionyl-tRNA formyltransferase
MSLKIVFMGTPDFAIPILKSIHNSANKIIEVYSQPPKKKNRGQKIQKSPIHELANELNISVRCPISLGEESEINYLKELNPDLVIVVAYGKILPTKILNLKNFLFLNVHASLLPRWRGAAPIQRAILNMDKETGISIMKIVPELDAGPVLMQSKINLTREINYGELSKKLSSTGAKIILEAIEQIKKKQANFIEQDISKVTYAHKIKKSESRIDWHDSANKIIAKIKAFYPNPGCWFDLSGSRIKIINAIEVKRSGIAGTVLDSKLTIACKKNAIQILELKKEGKNQMLADDFLKGNKIKIGQIIN